MSKPLATICRVDPPAVFAIRADLEALGPQIAKATGLTLPASTRISHSGARSLGWMSPDELLFMLPRDQAHDARVALEATLKDHHALIADVSDMRAVFDVNGAHAGDVIAKLCPADPDALADDGLRRTRAAQVACAFWRIEGGFRMIAFRSVADYLQSLLANAAIPGSELTPR